MTIAKEICAISISMMLFSNINPGDALNHLITVVVNILPSSRAMFGSPFFVVVLGSLSRKYIRSFFFQRCYSNLCVGLSREKVMEPASIAASPPPPPAATAAAPALRSHRPWHSTGS